MRLSSQAEFGHVHISSLTNWNHAGTFRCVSPRGEVPDAAGSWCSKRKMRTLYAMMVRASARWNLADMSKSVGERFGLETPCDGKGVGREEEEDGGANHGHQLVNVVELAVELVLE